ncbi:MAG TPA: preprotein translocase subunit SecE [Bryobacteraceae bacterium]|jgi:preprotein translocase SecE subunit
MAEELSVTQKAAAFPTQVREYYDELHLEMKRVTWPPWKQVQATTIVVIVAVFAFAGYFMVVDAAVGGIVQKLFDTFTKK